MKSTLHQDLQALLLKHKKHYILVTCENEGEGPIEVEMSYGGGDPILASFLLSGAQDYISEEVEENIDS